MTQISEVKEGIKLGFFGEVEKRSDVLGRNAVWTKQQRIKYVSLLSSSLYIAVVCLLQLYHTFDDSLLSALLKTTTQAPPSLHLCSIHALFLESHT